MIAPDDPRHGSNAGYSSGCRCDDCKRGHAAHKRAWEHGEMAPLPFAPLEPWMPQVLAAIPTESRLRDAVVKSRRRGTVTPVIADRAAIAIGLHPGLIWPDHWWLNVEDEVA